jgi:glycosyltransferase involved in cell wall biosynthesis
MHALHQFGHTVDLMGHSESANPIGELIPFEQISSKMEVLNSYDIIHFHFKPSPNLLENLNRPYVVTVHGNSKKGEALDPNSIFVSNNHAKRHGADAFVHNGLDWSTYPEVTFNKENRLHFLGNAAWKVKNLKGAIATTHLIPKGRLDVLGGSRLSMKMGVKLHLSIQTRFHGMVDDMEKSKILNHSSGMLFPVRWHEPFGLSIIESMYFGCPVFGTPYGSLPELVDSEKGALSSSAFELAQYAAQRQSYNSKHIHEYARDCFNSESMTKKYLSYYERVLNGDQINKKQPVGASAPIDLLPWN